jgi:hypothetical protein
MAAADDVAGRGPGQRFAIPPARRHRPARRLAQAAHRRTKRRRRALASADCSQLRSGVRLLDAGHNAPPAMPLSTLRE